ncbi:hypothetical protein [Cryobacterium sp. AP23]
MRIIWPGVAAFLVGAAWTIITGDQAPATVAIGIFLACVEVAVLMRRAGGFTAMVIPVVAVNAILLSSVFLWPVVAVDAIVSYRFTVTTEDLTRVAIIGMVFTAAFTAGALLIGRGRNLRHGGPQRFDIKLPQGALVFAAYAILAVTVVGYGESLIRGGYLGGTGPEWAVTMSNALTPVALLAVCLAAYRPGPARFLAVVGVVVWTLVLFGRSSRTLAALPAFLVVGQVLANSKPPRWFHIVTASVATIVLLQLPLALRVNSGGVGILTLGERLLSNPGEVFANFNPGAIIGNVLFSAPLAAVVSERTIPMNAFWVSVSPAFGSSSGWAEISPYLRIIPSTPYNAIGELASHGWLLLIITALATGMLLALSERIAASVPGVPGTIGIMLVMAVTALYSVSILQYNLRNSSRLVWYILIGVILLRFVALLVVRKSDDLTRHKELVLG